MSKILLILQREYLVRVKKRTFWILTFLIPLLYIGFIALVVVMNSSVKTSVQQVSVIDYSGLFDSAFVSGENIRFKMEKPGIEQVILKSLENEENRHLLIIPAMTMDSFLPLKLYSSPNASMSIKRQIEEMAVNRIRELRIQQMALSPDIVQKLNPEIKIESLRVTDEGISTDYSDVAMGIAVFLAFLNYFFIFLYGGLILRGVQEEKSNRIVELILSSVRPFELMMGKIAGVVLVGLTQFLLWVIFIVLLNLSAGQMISGFGNEMQSGFQMISEAIASIPVLRIVLFFLFFFITGYLLYSSLFAAIAAAVDNQSDMQQFMFPLTIPLIIAVVAIQIIIEAPDSPLAIWLSIIPFTSPIIMVGRVAVMEVPPLEIAGSMVLMILFILFTVWLSAKIYRIGILTFGSKVNYKTIWKWLTYR